MGGAVSELRAEIHAHALLVRHYPTLLEPVLAGEELPAIVSYNALIPLTRIHES